MSSDDRAFNRLFFTQYIWNHLKRRREIIGIPVRGVAEKLWIWHSYIVNLLNGRVVGNTTTFWKIAKLLWYSTKQFNELIIEAKIAEFEHNHWASHSISKYRNSKSSLKEILKKEWLFEKETINEVVEYIEFRKKKQKR